MPLMELRTSSKVCSAGQPVVYRVPHAPGSEPVSIPGSNALTCRPLSAVKPSIQPSLTPFSFRVSLRNFPLNTFRRRALPTRVPSLFAISLEASTHCEGSHGLATFRPQVFSTSRRFTPHSRLTGLFHPATTSRVLPVQGLLSSRSHPSSSEGACPLAVAV